MRTDPLLRCQVQVECMVSYKTRHCTPSTRQLRWHLELHYSNAVLPRDDKTLLDTLFQKWLLTSDVVLGTELTPETKSILYSQPSDAILKTALTTFQSSKYHMMLLYKKAPELTSHYTDKLDHLENSWQSICGMCLEKCHGLLHVSGCGYVSHFECLQHTKDKNRCLNCQEDCLHL